MNEYKQEYIAGIDEASKASLDVRREFYKLAVYWKYFAGCLIVALMIAYFFNRYTTALYKVNATVLIRNDAKTKSLNNTMLKEFDVFGTTNSVINEMGVIRSKSLSRKTVTDLNLYISYFYSTKKLGRSVEMYKLSPFLVEIDTSHLQIANVPIYVKILSKDQYSLEIEPTPAAYLIDINDHTVSDIISIDASFEKTCNFGQLVTTPYFSFKLMNNTVNSGGYDNGKDYRFLITDPWELGSAYSESLDVNPIQKDASVVEVSMVSNNPEKAIDFLNKLCLNYINIDLQEKNQTAFKTIAFIDEQLNEITDSLSSVENVLENFRVSNKVMDISDNSKAVSEKLAELDKEKALQNIEVKYYEYVVDYIKTKKDYTDLIIPSSLGISSTTTNSLVTELLTLAQTKNKLTISATEKNPYSIALENDIATTKQALLEDAQNNLSLAKIGLTTINKRIAEAELDVEKLPKKERQLLAIQRKFNVNDETYSYLLQKKAEASIAKASNSSDNRILDEAELVSQIYPKRKFNYIIALLAGLLVPFVFLKLRFYFVDCIIDRTDVESNSQLTLLGNIAHSKYESPLVILDNPRSMVSETIRSVKSNIDFVAVNDKCKVITFTSTISGEGKTFNAVNFACSFAASGNKTLLIGGDLRKPKLNQSFNIDNTKGLTSYLIGKSGIDEIIIPSHIENLSLLNSGPVPPNPSELLGSLKMKDLMDILRQRYDYIIFDTAPVGIVTDAIPLMRISDASIYILRYNFTRKRVLKDANDLSIKSGIKNLYLVLNDVRYKKNRYGRYYNRYGYTYAGGYYED